MRLGVIAALLAATVFATASLSSAFAQEVRGTYVVRIPPGTTQEGEAHYEPADIAIPVGTTILWFNDDPGEPHTVTSGIAGSQESGVLFDSEFMSEGSFFQHTFDEAGEYAYHCEVHPGAVGSIFVSDASEEGDNFTLSYGTGTTFDFTEHERTLLVLKPTSIDISEDEQVAYQITILKNGEEMFSEEFQTLGGVLYLELVPTDDNTQVTGPDISDPVIGAYHIFGSFLKDEAAYTIRAEITLLFDTPPEEPLVDEFGVQIVPEFPLNIMVIIAAGLGATILAGRRLRM